MAINLLPSEEKAKAKTEKKSREQTILMTGPTHSEKSRSSVKRAGVLTFFKGAFSRPKKPVVPEPTVQVPERKVNVEEHIIYQAAPAAPAKKVITYTKPTAQPMRQPVLQKDTGGFLARFIRHQPAPKASVTPTHPVGDQFPKYSSVRSEKSSFTAADTKQRNGDVIKVTTVSTDSHKPAHHDSLLQRLLAWLRGLFIHTHTSVPTHPPAVEIAAMPAPVQPTAPVRYTTAVVPPPVMRTTAPVVQQKSIIAVPPPPPPPQPKPILPPAPKPTPTPVISRAPVAPAAPTVPVIPIAPANEKKQSTEKTIPMTHVEPITKDSPKKYQSSWWSRCMKWLQSLFHHEPDKTTISTSPAGLGAGLPLGTNWEVNLVPEESLEQEISVSRVMALATFVVVAIGVVFGAWLWANWYYNSITTEINKMNNQIVIADIQIRSYEKMLDDIDTLRGQIENVSSLLDTHVYWSSFFTELERTTSPDVYYSSMSADVNGTVTLQAVGRDYDAAIKQLMVFEKATTFVSDVTVSGIVFTGSLSAVDSSGTATTPSSSELPTALVGETPVTFSIELVVQPAVFYFPSTL